MKAHKAATPAAVLTATAAVAVALMTSACTTSRLHSPASSSAPGPTESGVASYSGEGAMAVWPTYHNNAARTGQAATAKPVTRLKVTATAKLDGAIYASPLVLRDRYGPLIVAATENNTVYALRNNGSIVWSTHLGTPVDGGSLPCGDIDPTGITGTPAYDPSSGLIFAVAFLAGDHHKLIAIDATTGAVAWTRSADPPDSHPEVEQQRPALLVSDDRVWVAFGGLAGDCGPYHGYIVGVPTSGEGNDTIYQVPSEREAGIWTPAGPSADGQGHVFISVGNGAQTDPDAKYDMSDSVIELDTDSHVLSFFAPAQWAHENARDLDLGTTGPLLLPDGQIFVAGKDGFAYLLKEGDLGGVGAAIPTLALCTAFGGAAYLNDIVFVPCTNGVRAVRISGDTLTPLWHAKPAGSPVVGGGAVLSIDAKSGTLYALDPDIGSTKAKVSLGGPTTRFATPAIGDDGHAYVGTADGHLDVIATS